MFFSDILQETYSALTANKARSGLTVLGIVIGIASVIAMISIGEGAQANIRSRIEGLGSNILTITPGFSQQGRAFVTSGRGSAQTLKNEDAEQLKEIAGIAYISSQLQRRFQITSQIGNNTNTSVIGTTPEYLSVNNWTLDKGTFFTENHNKALARVAVLGSITAQDLFGENVEALGKTIRINKINFKVIGILKSKGGSGFFNIDDIVLIPLLTMQKILGGGDFLSSITISVVDKNEISRVKQEATDLLTQRHKVAEPDFSITSQSDIIGALSEVTATFTMFLASIAGISLVVGGIGIMNMMLTAIMERTREIGLKKAIGAKKQDITVQFLTEAVALTLLGGLLGIVFGWIISIFISSMAGITTQISLFAVLLAFGVSTAIGIIFGYYPARKAAAMNPIDALRYE